MATTQRVSRRTLLPLTGLTAAAILAGTVAPSLALAHPAPTLAQVQARITALGERANRLSEAYDAARIALAADRRAERQADARLRAVQVRIDALRAQVGRFAAAAYSSDGLGDSAMLLADDPATFLDQASALDALAQKQAEVMRELAVAQDRYGQAARSAHDIAARAESVQREIAARQHQIAAEIAAQQAVLSQLTASERAQYEASQRAEQAQLVGMRASYVGAASGQAAAAVQFAYAQLGKPYAYGAAGPDAYDCSGLTMAAWAAAGVSLPHNAAEQQQMLPYVPEGDLQPGDLVFFGSPAEHVGIYVGNGETIQATHTGDYVRMIPLSYMPDYSGAGRP